ncbi:MAG: hypothetical protein U1E27_04450 [Kiritimatiellia bacterium]|nr:hypothetical protein [Kiritimatiellia bacterium]
MKLTRRERILIGTTLGVVLLLILYFVGAPRWEQDRRLTVERAALARRVRDLERLRARRGEVESNLVVIRNRLPRHPAGQDVTADLLRDFERSARDQSVALTRREADRERREGELFEVSITGTWEAELDALVRFLYALETEGRMRQIRQLTISPSRENRLKGSVVVDHAYTRETEAAPRSGAGESR